MAKLPPHTVTLTVKNLAATDSWKDIVRIKDLYRQDENNKHINRGQICKLIANGHSTWVLMHGRNPNTPEIRMDLNTRLALKVNVGQTHQFQIHQCGMIERLWYPWKASDPGYRIAGQISLISLLLGTVLGIVGVVLAFH